MIRTIENDPASPFGDPEVPPAEWTYRTIAKDAFARGPQFAQAWLAQAGVDHLPDFPKGRSLERTVAAYVNDGRWLWDCPVCNAAQCCTPNDPRAFCVMCFNFGDGWWPVEFPDHQTTIEALLDRRPRNDQRNWSPHETVEQLQAENLSIGVDPDVPGLTWPGGQEALALVRKKLDLPSGEYVRALSEAAAAED